MTTLKIAKQTAETDFNSAQSAFEPADNVYQENERLKQQVLQIQQEVNDLDTKINNLNTQIAALNKPSPDATTEETAQIAILIQERAKLQQKKDQKDTELATQQTDQHDYETDPANIPLLHDWATLKATRDNKQTLYDDTVNKYDNLNSDIQDCIIISIQDLNSSDVMNP